MLDPLQMYDAREASSLSYKRDYIDIYTMGWGPLDTGGNQVEGPGTLTSRLATLNVP